MGKGEGVGGKITNEEPASPGGDIDTPPLPMRRTISDTGDMQMTPCYEFVPSLGVDARRDFRSSEVGGLEGGSKVWMSFKDLPRGGDGALHGVQFIMGRVLSRLYGNRLGSKLTLLRTQVHLFDCNPPVE